MFDTRGDYRPSCEHLAYLSPTLNSLNLQLGSEASLLSLICVTIILINIGVCPTSIHMFILLKETLHSGTYVGIGTRSQTVIGNCSRGLLTSTWCLTNFTQPFARLIEFSRQFSLFLFDILQAIGDILNIRWAHNGIVTTGSYCTAQGVIQQIGEVGVALSTLVCLLSLCLCVQDPADIRLTSFSLSTPS